MRRRRAQLHRTQSTVTYTINKLEDLLGLPLFEREGRRSVLTPAGQVLYRRGRTLLVEAGRLERAAAELAQGSEPEVRLAVEIIFPTWLLLDCLAQFGRERPETRVELIESVLAGTDEACSKVASTWPSAAWFPVDSSASRSCRSSSCVRLRRRIPCTCSTGSSRSTTCASTDTS
jgi:DNA-binding transcriptional ArsR family regulator